jgi:antitoxin MazE
LTENATVIEILFERKVQVETSSEIIAKKGVHRTQVERGNYAIHSRASSLPQPGRTVLAILSIHATMYLHVETKEVIMRLQLAKWGNSLAVRLPVECTRAAGLREGDTVEAEVTPAGEIRLTPAQPFDKAAFIKRLRKLRASMPMTTATVEIMRREDRY